MVLLNKNIIIEQKRKFYSDIHEYYYYFYMK